MAYTTINKPNTQFNTMLVTGNGSTQAVTGVNFQPDMVWSKVRSEVGSHRLVDSIRGVSTALFPNATDGDASGTYLSSFDSDGYTLGNGSMNESARTYAQWCWLAGGTASSNTDGSITSSVSVNTTSGFSIVSYTGTGSATTVGHGLGVAPSFIIIKNRSVVENWAVGCDAIAWTNYLKLNSTDLANVATSPWNNTAPTSSVFSIGTWEGTNASGNNYIAYCFAEKKGFSKFGSYIGNGSTDGPFIYTGFKPAMVIAKRTDSTGNWRIRDNKRSPYNVITDVLYPNSSSATITEDDHDFLSNGFKVRTTGPENNASGGTFIYMAFAENPLVTTSGVPATAR